MKIENLNSLTPKFKFHEMNPPTHAYNQLHDLVRETHQRELTRHSAIYRAVGDLSFNRVFYDAHAFFYSMVIDSANPAPQPRIYLIDEIDSRRLDAGVRSLITKLSAKVARPAGGARAVRGRIHERCTCFYARAHCVVFDPIGMCHVHQPMECATVYLLIFIPFLSFHRKQYLVMLFHNEFLAALSTIDCVLQLFIMN